MKPILLSTYLATNDVQKQRFAKVLGVSASQVSAWIKADMLVYVNPYGKGQLLKLSRKFDTEYL